MMQIAAVSCLFKWGMGNFQFLPGTGRVDLLYAAANPACCARWPRRRLAQEETALYSVPGYM